MNRAERRAGRIRAPGDTKGYLYPELLLIVERDTKGRPIVLHWCHDDEVVGDVIAEDQREKPEMLLVYIGDAAGFRS